MRILAVHHHHRQSHRASNVMLPTHIAQVASDKREPATFARRPPGSLIFGQVSSAPRWKMRVHVSFMIGLIAVSAACVKRLDVQCIMDSNCDLSDGGVCTTAPTG